MTFSQCVLPVVFDCLLQMTSRPKEKPSSTPTPCGIIKNILHATLEIWSYCVSVSSRCRHQSVISGTQDIELISIGLEWSSLQFRLICSQFRGNSRRVCNSSDVAVNKHAGQSLCPGVVSASLSGVKHSSSSLDKSYGYKENWPDLQAIAGEMRFLLIGLSGLMTGRCLCSEHYLFSTFFRNACWYWIVYEVSSSGWMSIPLSSFLTDHNFEKGSWICAKKGSIHVILVTSIEYFAHFYHAYVTMK